MNLLKFKIRVILRTGFDGPSKKWPIDIEGTILKLDTHKEDHYFWKDPQNLIRLFIRGPHQMNTRVIIRWDNDIKGSYETRNLVLRSNEIPFFTSIWNDDNSIELHQDTRPYYALRPQTIYHSLGIPSSFRKNKSDILHSLDLKALLPKDIMDQGIHEIKLIEPDRLDIRTEDDQRYAIKFADGELARHAKHYKKKKIGIKKELKEAYFSPVKRSALSSKKVKKSLFKFFPSDRDSLTPIDVTEIGRYKPQKVNIEWDNSPVTEDQDPPREPFPGLTTSRHTNSTIIPKENEELTYKSYFNELKAKNICSRSKSNLNAIRNRGYRIGGEPTKRKTKKKRGTTAYPNEYTATPYGSNSNSGTSESVFTLSSTSDWDSNIHRK